MPTAPITTYSGRKLEPYMDRERVTLIHVNLPASIDYARGTVLGETAGTNERQRLVITGGPTGGTFTMTFGGQTTAALAYNATADQIRDALEALSTIGDGNIGVTGGPLPGAQVFIEFRGSLGGANQAALTTTDSLTGGSSPATAITTLTGGAAGTAGTFKAYDNDATDGSEVAKAILPFDVVTDSDGKITYSGDVSTGNEWGQKHLSVPVYVRGVFKTSELTGLDSRAVDQLGRLLSGTVADGILSIG